MVIMYTMMIITLVSTIITLTTSTCPKDMLVVYRLSLRTEWDEKIFPKQFPQWRPSAQWSKTIGYSHSPDYSPLYSVGSIVSEGVREFAETGATDTLEKEVAKDTIEKETVGNNFLDAIIAPPIEQGVGETSTNVFVDTNHTKVSVMTKIVPSPDWFIGLDSVDLCKEGAFTQQIIIEGFPLDAGTDNGFTFTSPNWATEPRGEVFRITSQFPQHPAGSFHYPHLARLPTIAVYTLTKLREYTLQQRDGDNNSSDPDNKTVRDSTVENSHTVITEAPQRSKYRYDVINKDRQKPDDILNFIPMIRKAKKDKHNDVLANLQHKSQHKKRKVGLLGTKPSRGFRSSTSLQGYYSSTSPDNFFKKKYESALVDKATRRILPGTLQTLPKRELYQHIMQQYRKGGIKTRKKKLRRRKNKKKRKPQNCSVSSWSVWGECSQSCGIGEAVRTRTIIHHPKHGGQPCPPTKDYKWCGSARNCNQGYFKW